LTEGTPYKWTYLLTFLRIATENKKIGINGQRYHAQVLNVFANEQMD